jgi:hypothetical protein
MLDYTRSRVQRAGDLPPYNGLREREFLRSALLITVGPSQS